MPKKNSFLSQFQMTKRRNICKSDQFFHQVEGSRSEQHRYNKCLDEFQKLKEFIELNPDKYYFYCKAYLKANINIWNLNLLTDDCVINFSKFIQNPHSFPTHLPKQDLLINLMAPSDLLNQNASVEFKGKTSTLNSRIKNSK